MPIKVNGKYILPAPLVSFEKVFHQKGGRKIGAGYNVTMQGYLIPNKGNPVYSGVLNFSNAGWTSTFSPDDDQVTTNAENQLLIATIGKQEAIRQTFSTGCLIEILGFDSASGIRFYGAVNGISFDAESKWALPTPYTVSLTTNNFLDSSVMAFSGNSSEDAFNYYISDVEENWGIAELDQVTVNSGDYTQVHKVYGITHNLNAVGSPVYNSSGNYLNGLEPWQQASGWVRSQSFGSGSTPPAIMLPGSYGIANHKFVEQVDKYGGSYGIQEEYTMYNSGLLPFPVLENISVSQERGEDGVTTVSVQGNIIGMETNSPYGASKHVVSKYNNALNYYNTAGNIIYTRAKSISGLTWLHPKALTESVSKDVNLGSISYTQSFNDRPPNLIPNSISENIEISDTYPGQITAIIPCIGRSQPIIQYLNARSEYRRILSINVVMNPVSRNWNVNDVNNSGYWTNISVTGIRNWLITQKPSVVSTVAFSSIYSAVNPANIDAVSGKTFYEAPQESWNPRLGTYSYSVGFVYTKS